MMRSANWVAGLFLAVASLPAPAHAQKSADTLRLAWRDAIPNVDPYMNSLRTGLVVAHQAWDTLTYRDPETFQIKPLLATSWRLIDDTTLEFTLREGVKFHNGDPFTAADVVYTVGVITDPKSGITTPSNFTWLAGAEATDDFHVRLKLKQAFPAALEYVSMVLPIYPKAYREKLGADAYAKTPVGAGPYRITKVDGASEIDLERFDDYYVDSPKGKPAIRRIVIKEVADATTELTLLIGGQADWIWMFSSDQFENIGRLPTLQAQRNESMRITFLQFDAAGRTGKDNPLTKQKVRQAIAYAIDRETIAKQLVQGGARVPDGPCYFTQFGCDAAAQVHYGYDPTKAKLLLDEAGYPNGFETEIVAGILPTWTAAVQNYLAAVGIRAKTTTLQAGAVIQRNQAGDVPIYINSWGSYSINDVSAIMPYFFSGNADDDTRDAEVTALIKQGGSISDPDQRRRAYSAALKRITEQAYWLPLTTSVTNYAFSRALNFKPFPDELPRFYLSSWK